jgi:hypothetical protein
MSANKQHKKRERELKQSIELYRRTVAYLVRRMKEAGRACIENGPGRAAMILEDALKSLLEKR